MMGTVANQPKTPGRSIRIADDVWKPALAKAKREDTDLTKVILGFLIEYLGDEAPTQD